MSELADQRLLDIIQVTEQNRFRSDFEVSFCLNSLLRVTPTSPDAVLAKDALLRETISDDREHAPIKCLVEGCTVTAYATGATEDTFTLDGNKYTDSSVKGVYTEMCKINVFCLQDAWDVGGDIEHKPLRDAVRQGAYTLIKSQCENVTGGSFIGGYTCPRLDCQLSAGFSVDGVGGTDGACAQKCDKTKEALEEPLSVSAEQ